jgi:hypothetical protein
LAAIGTRVRAIICNWDKLTVRIAGRTKADCGIGIAGEAFVTRGQLK